ncbi:hypothetical protein [Pseudomonas mandelii]|uniref:Uncharacterized protein n=1 Tax=Pseudomonas mandelii TaxID=75612 RepID=A0AB36CSN4_9PSED|nr:hypothetical protein [Pseudomonas mandelii]NMZ78969.1 hypothetical protein [Pseudomonas mandelii]
MSKSLDRFTLGLMRAFERRLAMQQQTKECTQTTQQIDSSVVSATATKQPAKKLDEVYKESLLSKMRVRLSQMKANDSK